MFLTNEIWNKSILLWCTLKTIKYLKQLKHNNKKQKRLVDRKIKRYKKQIIKLRYSEIWGMSPRKTKPKI